MKLGHPRKGHKGRTGWLACIVSYSHLNYLFYLHYLHCAAAHDAASPERVRGSLRAPRPPEVGEKVFAGAELLQSAGEDLLQLHAADLLLYSLPLNTADWVLECCIVSVYYCGCVHGPG